MRDTSQAQAHRNAFSPKEAGPVTTEPNHRKKIYTQNVGQPNDDGDAGHCKRMAERLWCSCWVASRRLLDCSYTLCNNYFLLLQLFAMKIDNVKWVGRDSPDNITSIAISHYWQIKSADPQTPSQCLTPMQCHHSSLAAQQFQLHGPFPLDPSKWHSVQQRNIIIS